MYPMPSAQCHSYEGPQRPLLLWIDDFGPGLMVYRAIFERNGFRVITASSGREGLRLATLHNPDVVVTDYEMPEMVGKGVALALKALYPAIPVIMYSGSTLVPLRVRRSVTAFCDKASSRDQLLSTIYRVMAKKPSHPLQPSPLPPASNDGHRTVA
jgi:CheY-like chemotaxis protein